MWAGVFPRQKLPGAEGPGIGKSTFCAHFVGAASNASQKALWITLSEPASHIRDQTARVGIDFSSVDFLDLSPGPEIFRDHRVYGVFSPDEVEGGPLVRRVVETVEACAPRRVVIDSLSQLRFLARDPHQFHTLVLSLLRFLTATEATVLLTSEASAQAPDEDLQFLVDGIVELVFVGLNRKLRVTKWREASFRAGWHSFILGEFGLRVFPRLELDRAEHDWPFAHIASGIPALNELLMGGINRGTVTLITGPSGVGKTTLKVQFMKEAAARGERSVIFHFEEPQRSIFARGERVNIPVSTMIEQGNLRLVPIDPFQVSADPFARMVREEVEQQGTTLVMLGSASGYKISVRGGNM